MKFKRDITRLRKRQIMLDGAIAAINTKVQSICDFEIHLDCVPGDGWCFSAEITGFPLYMQMEDVLRVVEENGKFSADDWNPFG